MISKREALELIANCIDMWRDKECPTIKTDSEIYELGDRE